MFDHVTIRVSDREASEGFYETVLRTLGIEQTASDEHYAEWDDFSSGTSAENVHVAFPASENATVEAFHRSATEAGYRDNGGPGERAVYHAGTTARVFSIPTATTSSSSTTTVS